MHPGIHSDCQPLLLRAKSISTIFNSNNVLMHLAIPQKVLKHWKYTNYRLLFSIPGIIQLKYPLILFILDSSLSFLKSWCKDNLPKSWNELCRTIHFDTQPGDSSQKQGISLWIISDKYIYNYVMGAYNRSNHNNNYMPDSAYSTARPAAQQKMTVKYVFMHSWWFHKTLKLMKPDYI